MSAEVNKRKIDESDSYTSQGQSISVEKVQGKKLEDVNMTCSLGTSRPFPLVLFCVAYSHTG